MKTRTTFGLAATLAATSFALTAEAQSLDDIDQDALSFDIMEFAADEERAGFALTAIGQSNGIGFEVVPGDRSSIYLPFSNPDGDQLFDDLPRAFDAVHIGTNLTITFDRPVEALLVATANDNGTGDGFDFGMLPAEMIDLRADGTFLHSEDMSGTLALFVLSEPQAVWISDSEDDLTDGIDLAFFAFETWR